jgi:hypothetical protein
MAAVAHAARACVVIFMVLVMIALLPEPCAEDGERSQENG